MEYLAGMLARTSLVEFIDGYNWSWPLMEICHFVGMALLIGTVGLVDLRVLGVAKGIPIAQLERLIPWGIAGFVMNAVTGFVFIAGNVGGPMEYLTNLSLQLKFLLILLAGINLLMFYSTGIARMVRAIPAYGDAPISAKVVAATSLVVWLGVIFLGRLIMYNDTLLYALGR